MRVGRITRCFGLVLKEGNEKPKPLAGSPNLAGSRLRRERGQKPVGSCHLPPNVFLPTPKNRPPARCSSPRKIQAQWRGKSARNKSKKAQLEKQQATSAPAWLFERSVSPQQSAYPQTSDPSCAGCGWFPCGLPGKHHPRGGSLLLLSDIAARLLGLLMKEPWVKRGF